MTMLHHIFGICSQVNRNINLHKNPFGARFSQRVPFSARDASDSEDLQLESTQGHQAVTQQRIYDGVERAPSAVRGLFGHFTRVVSGGHIRHVDGPAVSIPAAFMTPFCPPLQILTTSVPDLGVQRSGVRFFIFLDRDERQPAFGRIQPAEPADCIRCELVLGSGNSFGAIPAEETNAVNTEHVSRTVELQQQLPAAVVDPPSHDANTQNVLENTTSSIGGVVADPSQMHYSNPPVESDVSHLVAAHLSGAQPLPPAGELASHSSAATNDMILQSLSISVRQPMNCSFSHLGDIEVRDPLLEKLMGLLMFSIAVGAFEPNTSERIAAMFEASNLLGVQFRERPNEQWRSLHGLHIDRRPDMMHVGALLDVLQFAARNGAFNIIMFLIILIVIQFSCYYILD
jgi:hypothetical protein